MLETYFFLGSSPNTICTNIFPKLSKYILIFEEIQIYPIVQNYIFSQVIPEQRRRCSNAVLRNALSCLFKLKPSLYLALISFLPREDLDCSPWPQLHVMLSLLLCSSSSSFMRHQQKMRHATNRQKMQHEKNQQKMQNNANRI